MILSQQRTNAEKRELHRRSQSKKVIQKQSFKLAFLMRPKTDTAMASRKKWKSSFCFIFPDFFLVLHNSRKIIVWSVFHELSYGITFVSIRFSTPKSIPCYTKCQIHQTRRWISKKPVKNWSYGNFSWIVCGQEKIRKNKTEGRCSFFPVGHCCTGFGSPQESEFKRLFLDQFFTLKTTMEFLSVSYTHLTLPTSDLV